MSHRISAPEPYHWAILTPWRSSKNQEDIDNGNDLLLIDIHWVTSKCIWVAVCDGFGCLFAENFLSQWHESTREAYYLHHLNSEGFYPLNVWTRKRNRIERINRCGRSFCRGRSRHLPLAPRWLVAECSLTEMCYWIAELTTTGIECETSLNSQANILPSE